MNADEPLDSIVDEEELRALLGDGGTGRRPRASGEGWTAAGPADSPGPRFPVIVASRRRTDAELLVERLKAVGLRVDVVRDAFRALDLVRTGDYAAILTDSSLWADGARLLFERIESMAAAPLVVLLSDRDSGASVRKAGVAGELLCPLSSLELTVAVDQLVAAATERRAALEAGRDGSRAIEPIRPDDHAPSVDGAVAAGESSDAFLASRSALSLGPYRWEMPWLRFFLEVQRRLRTSATQSALFASVVDLGRRVLGAEAAGIGVFTEGQLTAYVNAASVTTVGDRGPERRTLLAELGECLESGEVDHVLAGPPVFSLDAHEASGETGVSPDHRKCRIVLLGLSRPTRSAGLLFRDDLHSLLVEVLRR